MEKLEEIGVDEMLEHLRGASTWRSRENFFPPRFREESTDMDADALLHMRNRLHEACQQGPEDTLLQQITRRLRDPIRPATETGAWRPHPLLLVWGGVALMELGIFLYWSFF